MTYEELLARINKPQIHTIHYQGLGSEIEILTLMASRNALRAVVELHKPFQFEDDLDIYKPVCIHCQNGVVGDSYPCETIQAIEKELG